MAKGSQNDAKQLSERLLQVIADQFGVPGERIQNESHFVYDLGLDSLDLAQLQLEMEEEFKIRVTDMDMKKVATVGDALLFLKRTLEQR